MSEMRPDAITPDAATPGRVLAAAREASGLSVTEVAARLKYSPRQIEAIEADRFDLLPAAAMARGMIRNYAKLVGIDASPLLADLKAQFKRGPETVQPANLDVPFRSAAPRRGSFAYVLLSIFVLLVVVGIIIEWSMPATPPTPVAAKPAPPADASPPTPAAPPVVEAPPAPPPPTDPAAAQAPQETATPTRRIELAFDKESWVQIRDAKGEILLSRLNAAGTRQSVEGIPPFSFVIGNARGVRMRYDDADVNLAPYTQLDVARFTLK